MQPDWNIILGFAAMALLMVGGFVRIMGRLQKIETRLEVDDKGKPDRDAARRLEIADIARGELRIHKAECPARENTGVRDVPIGGL